MLSDGTKYFLCSDICHFGPLNGLNLKRKLTSWFQKSCNFPLISRCKDKSPKPCVTFSGNLYPYTNQGGFLSVDCKHSSYAAQVHGNLNTCKARTSSAGVIREYLRYRYATAPVVSKSKSYTWKMFKIFCLHSYTRADHTASENYSFSIIS